jgi:hypothetical protein
MNRAISSSLAVAAMLTAAATTPAADLYVNGAAAGDGQGTQQSPFRTVQAAIDAAGTGDVIRVAAGSYNENLRIVSKAIVLEGGYSAAWVRDLAANTTTISGPAGDAAITLIEADATIDGFRITGGTGSTEEQPYGYHGGGIYSRDGSPTIVNNLIEDNHIVKKDENSEYNFGGGVYVSGAPRATIINNTIRNNSAGRGGGVSVVGEVVVIRGNVVEGNEAVGDHGGGLYVAGVDAQIAQNIVRGNAVGEDLGYGWGGGLIFFGAGNSAEIAFNVVYDNFAAAYGAGEFVDEGARADIHHELVFRNRSTDGCEAVSAIAVDGGEDGGSDVTIRHCTVVGNVCEDSVRGNGLQVEGNSTARVSNCIFWNNAGDDFSVDPTSTLSVSFTCSQEAIEGAGNISSDPRFVNEAGDDYHLAAGSPCIDAGDPDAPFADEPAPNGGRADMGRFGNAGELAVLIGSPFGSSSGGGTGGTGAGGGGTNGGGNAETDETEGAVLAAAPCPTAAALLVSLSLIGMCRARRVGKREAGNVGT